MSDEVGVPRPSTVVTANNTHARQLLALANREGAELAKRYQWQALIKEFTHTTLAQENQGLITTLMPGINIPLTETFWNRSEQVTTPGSVTPQRWQLLKASGITGPYSEIRFRAGSLLMIPAPAAGDTLAGEYVSKYFCQSSGGTDQTAWAADTDVAVLDDDLMEMGIIWRWRKMKGYEWQSYRVDYEIAVKERISSDVPRERVNMCADGQDRRYGGVAVPEGSWSL